MITRSIHRAVYSLAEGGSGGGTLGEGDLGRCGLGDGGLREQDEGDWALGGATRGGSGGGSLVEGDLGRHSTDLGRCGLGDGGLREQDQGDFGGATRGVEGGTLGEGGGEHFLRKNIMERDFFKRFP
uniref:Uncharacterized protein n=1 Tax=Cacopsylla melanoneura TaxID=428564 RepID=A0A8D9E4U4_9HEMI